MRLVLSALSLAAITFVGWGMMAPILFTPWAALTLLMRHALGGKQWATALSAFLAYALVAGCAAFYLWVPSAFYLEVGGTVMIEHGVASAAYYRDLWEGLAVFALAVLVASVIYPYRGIDRQ